MALYPASDSSGFSDSYAAIADSSDVIFTGSVELFLSTGTTQQVCGTLATALTCIHFMGQQKLYNLSPDEDIAVINLRSELSVLENTGINQKMVNSYVCTYHGNQVQAIHRSMADMVSLSDALASLGFRCIGLAWSTDANPKMETDRTDKDRPRIQVVHYVYESRLYLIATFKVLSLLQFQVSKCSKEMNEHKRKKNIYIYIYVIFGP